MHTPPVEAYSPSTARSFRWSRLIAPRGGPDPGGLTALTSTPAARMPLQNERGTSRHPNQSCSTLTVTPSAALAESASANLCPISRSEEHTSELQSRQY